MKTQLTFSLLVGLLLLSKNAIAGITLFYENFSGTTQGWTTTTWSSTGPQTTFYEKASGGNYMNTPGGISPSTYTLELANNISTIGYKQIRVSWGGKNNGDNPIKLYYSTDGITYHEITGWTDAGNNWANVTSSFLPVAAENVQNLRFRWRYSSNLTGFLGLGGNSIYNIDDILISAEPNEGITSFNWSGKPVGENPFSVSGVSATAPYTIDGVTMQWTKVSDAGVNLTNNGIATTYQGLPALALLQNGATATSGTVMHVRFNKALEDLTFTLYDVDNTANQFQDGIVIKGFLGEEQATLGKVKVLTSTTNEFVAAQSRVQGIAGTSEAANNSTAGNVTVTFPSAVDRLEISYYNLDAAAGNQGIGIGDFSWRKIAAPLPVSLLRFKARLEDGKNILSWQTASEKNNAFFRIERSHDGIHFTVIGKVQGMGNSANLQYYQFEDEKPLKGINYYRLQQIDFDGTSEYSPIISVATTSLKQMSLEIHPNPVSSILKLNFGDDMVSEIEIVDLNGRVVKKLQVMDAGAQQEINVCEIPAGMYVIRAVSGYKILSNKFLKTN